MADDNLFVVGRNVYQAACGGSNDASHFIRTFIEGTGKFPEGKRKAILDGMLFEIFFDPNAKLREKIKANLFNDLFELQKFVALKESFAFISETLIAAGGQFYAVPGKDHILSITVATKKVKDAFLVEGIYLGSVDILRLEDNEFYSEDEGTKSYVRRSCSQLEEQLSQEMIVPSRLLKVKYTPPSAAKGPIKFPMGWTVRKT